MPKSLKYTGSQDWLDDEFGQELVWNELKPGDKVILFHDYHDYRDPGYHSGGKYNSFCEVTLNEHLRNCHMITFKVEEYINKYYNEPKQNQQNYRKGSWTVEPMRLKKQAGFVVYRWNTDLVKDREIRKIAINPNRKPIMGDEFRKNAESRKAHAAHRDILAQAKSRSNNAFEMLGLSVTSTSTDLKARRRELLSTYHPDLLRVFISQGGNEEEFNLKSKQITDAISEVLVYITRRDETQAVIDQVTKVSTP